MSERLDLIQQELSGALQQIPIVAILRGIRKEEALGIVGALFNAGIRVAEVPLNSPDPFATIRLLVQHFGDQMLIGAGTVTTVEEVKMLASTGAKISVSPNTNAQVIRAALEYGLVPIPGFVTPTEAFEALAAGAKFLKFFPASGRVSDLAAMNAVLPRDVTVVAVGGVGAANGSALFAAGAKAFGIGSDLFRTGMTIETIRDRATKLVSALSIERLQRRIKQISNPHAIIGESPKWCEKGGKVYWVDPIRKLLFSSDRDGDAQDSVVLDKAVWSIGFDASGQMVGVTADGLCKVFPFTGMVEQTVIADQRDGCRFNDFAIDSRGGMWVGSMHKGLLAGKGAIFYAASVDSPVVEVASGLGVPNGMAYDFARARLYVIDTLSRTLIAYSVDEQNACLREPVIISDFMGLMGKPDGMALANDGSLWVAMWGGGMVVQISPDGEILQTIVIPSSNVSSACFSSDGSLFVTTSRMRLSEAQLDSEPGAGALFAIEFCD
ncbi:2-dehydro-3-deoxy-6-phosphogalactonate aldolase [Undibacterium sp. LX40W]|uniref:2-dehydro-3-deoxy-6-phosphogalactonate aldolase n=1 Tax=Undibacterium nitidum TaxID=2762298 RepID=A0A923HRL3_9BURK|nr:MULTISPECIES: 2-dehydro-3-deoxy-6-phosphogalactonate aldolase [Undibacterium]MBC3881197.1 2-dehydro-3-deoxy-6-phosphogalactonate aldolase [Undibacterium nitidum]MBC3890070.1 2-dehydro-3-deoxy-6-phosphogalactonate aldolase [Undibacterium sp. LX40W]